MRIEGVQVAAVGAPCEGADVSGDLIGAHRVCARDGEGEERAACSRRRGAEDEVGSLLAGREVERVELRGVTCAKLANSNHNPTENLGHTRSRNLR